MHMCMAWENGLHKQYLDSEKGYGLRRAFILLNRWDLVNSSTKGSFHEQFPCTLRQVMEAHIHALWIDVGGVAKLEDLRCCNGGEQQKMQPDQELIQVIMFLCDVLHYFVLTRGMKHGDVDLMEAMLPFALLRFIGGRNSHYTGEILELMQGLAKEWPEDLANFVREHCWLMNTSGKPDEFIEADRIMEEGIKDIKVTHPSKGPKIDWKYLKKLHPIIPLIRIIAEHVEHEFQTFTRYKKHTTPHDIKGIHLLQKTFTSSEANLHKYIPN
ncbi:hypothetical protein C8Q75DRAFT_109257 [Abortiporus biennis]|nr:hypothetical protein C8Q75DRAFT_109257 [Abortiporus biennis]